MTKKETFKWIVQIIASVATAILTALGTTSCMVLDKKSVLELFQGALALFYGVTLFMGAYVLQVDTYLVL